MFHVKHIVSVLLLCFPFWSMGQSVFKLNDIPFVHQSPMDTSLFDYITTQTKGRGLTETELGVYYWTNYVRKNPIAFLNTVLKPFLKQFPEAKGVESASLETDLKALPSLPLLKFSPLLQDAALFHANDLTQKGSGLSHSSTKGLSFAQRMKLAGMTGCAAENLYTGKNDGLLPVLMLLLDIGLTPPGHRKNLLNSNYTAIGLSIRPNKDALSIVLVQDFGCH